MPSSYTTNLGIEKPATGEQAGTWGGTVNVDLDQLDQAISGYKNIVLTVPGNSGAPNEVKITNTAARSELSDGRNVYIEFTDGGDLGADAYVQFTPDTSKKVGYIKNGLSANRSLYLFQGTYNASRDYVVTNGKTFLLKFSGDGAASSTVVDIPVQDAVMLSGNQTVAGVKTFSSDPLIPDEAYGSGWNGSLEPPTKNAVYDAIREKLTAARTYYVRTDGNDSNTGLVDSAGGAFLTIQKALDVVATLDLGGYVATIQVRDGTYTGAVEVPIFTGNNTATDAVILQGNTGTPANCVISRAGDCISVSDATYITIAGFKLVSSGSSGLVVGYNSRVEVYEMDFGACSYAQMACYDGGKIFHKANYTISGSTTYHMDIEGAGSGRSISWDAGLTVTLTGTPDFSGTFAGFFYGAVGIENGITYSGACTGKRYWATMNGVINTFGGGANYYPGDSAGVTATGGQYA